MASKSVKILFGSKPKWFRKTYGYGNGITIEPGGSADYGYGDMYWDGAGGGFQFGLGSKYGYGDLTYGDGEGYGYNDFHHQGDELWMLIWEGIRKWMWELRCKWIRKVY